MSDMKSYLAAKYMSGPKADAILAHSSSDAAKKLKKKRKKDGISSSTSTTLGGIRDDDAGWGGADAVHDEEDPNDLVVASDRSFKKRKVDHAGKSGGWATLQPGLGGVKEESPPPAADEIPLVVQEDEQKPFVGGLVTADQLATRLGKGGGGPDGKKGRRRPDEETEAERRERELAQETVYRDASGRKIDTKAERAEAARKKREREEKEALKMEWGKGVVQREDEEKRRAELEKERHRDLARYADDRAMNDEMKAQDRWNDPAAAFLTKKRSKGPRKPEYTGPTPPPNRFGIKPGYRWDGVDRSNGFEKKFFQRANEGKRRGLESYQWSAEDM